VRFTQVGILGFLVDSTVLYALAWIGLGWFVGRVGSYLAAASFTWIANRRYTFESPRSPSVAEWGQFIAANSIGGIVNYIVYAVLFATVNVVAHHPVLGVASGSIAGLLINFFLSARLFRAIS
jgi:putative flippase GtrA